MIGAMQDITERTRAEQALRASEELARSFQEQLKTAKARTPSPAWPKIDDAIGTAVTTALKGQATPQKALDQAATAIDGFLKGS